MRNLTCRSVGSACSPFISESSSECKEAFVTLATNNNYAHGVLALGESLRRTGTTRDMVAMLTEGVTEDMRSVVSTGRA